MGSEAWYKMADRLIERDIPKIKKAIAIRKEPKPYKSTLLSPKRPTRIAK